MIWIVGSSGNLGVAITKLLKSKNIPFYGTDSSVDIKNIHELEKISPRPNIIINCAAATNVDWCEDNIKEAMHINAIAMHNLGAVSKKFNSKLIHISTDYVFDGKYSHKRNEWELCDPIQVYGRSKFRGEEIALEYDATIARIQWVLGHKNNFVRWIKKCLETGEECNLSTTQYGSPCSVDYIANQILRLFSVSGVWHITHDDCANRYEVGLEVAKILSINPCDILFPVDNLVFGKAARPNNTRLSNEKYKRHFGINESDSWRTDLKKYLLAL